MKTKVSNFLTSSKGSGVAMIVAMIIAFVWVNSPLAASYELIHHAPFSIKLGDLGLEKPLILWINEGLMVVFFFLIGLEIKREILNGQLSTFAKISLPAAGAIGGMVIPAFIYLIFNYQDPDAIQGWAIPVATDIVLVLALLSLLGNRVPISLKIFLTALAVFDDLGTLVVIATLYSEGLSYVSIALAGLGVGVLTALNRLKVSNLGFYFIIGLFVWLAVLESGVHATIAGVLVAMTIPLRAHGKEVLSELEHKLTPWVALGVVPLFAFFNSGINISALTPEIIFSPISLGVIFGLFFGKQIGVLLGVFLAIRVNLSTLPAGCSWLHVYGAAILTGVGFTMGLFVTGLAFDEPGLILSTNFSIIIGSAGSAILGMFVLRAAKLRPRNDHRT